MSTLFHSPTGVYQESPAMEAYQTYINQMKKKGWENKIPKRVIEHCGVKNDRRK